MERRKTWCRGHTDRPGWRELVLFEDGGQWWLRGRGGAVAAGSRWMACADEDAAWDLARDLMAGPEPWREVPG